MIELKECRLLPERALGVPLYLDDSMGWIHYAIQVRFPRTKRRRIRRKWARDPRKLKYCRIQLPRVRCGSNLESKRFYVNTPMLRNLQQPARDEFEKFCRETVVIMNANLRMPQQHDGGIWRFVDECEGERYFDRLLADEPFVWDILRDIDAFGPRAAKSPLLVRLRRLLTKNRAEVWGND